MYLAVSLIILSVVTYIPRVIPLIINKQIKSNYIKSILYYMPYCVLISMTFPAVFYCTNNFYISLVGTLVAIILSYRQKSLIIVAMSSTLVIYGLNILLSYI